jgi:excisionase family DNA binding protein
MPAVERTPPEAVSPRCLAATLGFTPKTIRRLIHEGELRAHRVGRRHWRIFRQDIEDFLARRANRSAA